MQLFSLSEMHVIVLGKLDIFKEGANDSGKPHLSSSFQASLTAPYGSIHSISENSCTGKNHSGNRQNSVH